MCGFQGDQAVLKFDYSKFENIERGLVTPSQYNWMTSWIQGSISAEHLDALVQGDASLFQMYVEDAHRAYHDLPWQERLANHKDTMTDLVEERDALENAEREIRRTDNPFNPSSLAYTAYNTWANEKIAEYSRVAMQISDELDEEELWEQGGEDGASQTDGPRYDESDEI
jgi:hypothetical protein